MQTHPSRHGQKGFWEARLALSSWGFDLSIFRSEAEIQFAAHYVADLVVDSPEFERLALLGVTPAWIIGSNGPFIGIDGMKKLATAFELGKQIGKDTSIWIEHLTSVEVIKMLPRLYN